MSYTDLNLDLTDEHVSLKENAHKFALEVLRPAAIELDTMTPDQVIAKGSPYWDCMRKMYENGYHTVLIPDEYGGLGLDPLGIHIVFEELGYGSAGFAVSIGVSCFSAFYSSLIAEDHHINKFIIPFTDNFHNPRITQQVKATRKGDRYLLNGQKAAWVSNGTIATQAAIFVNIDPSAGMAGGGIGLIDLTQKGVTRGRPLNKMGQRELPQGEIYFDNAEVPVEDMIIDPESYEMFTDITLATANACMGAFFTGVAQSAYDLALAYTKERIQGGKALCEHLSVQKKLFDMFSKVELARALSRAALQFNLSTSPPKTQYSIASKVFATTAAFEVASDALQLFGGNGLSKEYPIEKIFRDARAGMIEDGSNDILALAAAGLILRGE
jgi:alkylation response protein AidB-like acyl-CoA dehydrogenase